MANIFNSVELKRPAFSRFNKSFKEKYTCNIGELYPIYFEEVVPGSKVRLNASHFVRFQPMLAPVFDSMHYRQYYFFVPYRLLCTLSQDKWEEFRTGGKDQVFENIGVDGNTYIPFFEENNTLDELNDSDFLDYYRKFFNAFQLPNGFFDKLRSEPLGRSYSAFPFFAYWKIICDYFCDEQLDIDLIDVFNEFFGNDNDASFQNLFYSFGQLSDGSYRGARFFRKRYKKDYFTSATLQPQLGTGISLPLNTGISFDAVNPDSLLQIISDTFNRDSTTNTNLDVIAQSDNVGSPYGLHINQQGSLIDAGLIGTIRGANVQTWQDLAQQFKLTNNGLFSVDDLRNSFLMQELLERNNVAGYRYFEWIYSHFGIVSPDARLQRSEFLGSTDDVINFVEVEQTNSASESSDTPLGYLAGKGIGGGANAIFDRTFSEDGIIIGLACYVPENTYYQGIPKMYLRKNGLDMLTPLFERLGEQAISNEELVFNGDSRDNEVFGYTSRYADYKSARNIAKGDFTDTLKFWTFARDLSGFGLSSDFLQINYEDFDDCFAVQSDVQGKPLVFDKILCVQNFDIIHRLPLHRYSNPARI